MLLATSQTSILKISCVPLCLPYTFHEAVPGDTFGRGKAFVYIKVTSSGYGTVTAHWPAEHFHKRVGKDQMPNPVVGFCKDLEVEWIGGSSSLFLRDVKHMGGREGFESSFGVEILRRLSGSRARYVTQGFLVPNIFIPSSGNTCYIHIIIDWKTEK